MTTFRPMLFATLFLAGANLVMGGAAKVSPIQKVTELLKEMVAKGTAAANDEATKYSAFAQWCADEMAFRKEAITEANGKIEHLDAEIGKMGALIEDLSGRILELKEDVGRWKKDETSASDIRVKESHDYQLTQAEYTETLAAIDGAIAVLQKKSADLPQALLQVYRLKLVQPESKGALAAFLRGTGHAALLQGEQPNVVATDQQMPDNQLFYEAPEANAYEFHSGGIIEMLEKLKDQFEKQKYELEKDELTARHGYEGIMQQLADSIENANHEIEKKTALRAHTEEDKAVSEGELAKTIAERDEDQQSLHETTALCDQKKFDFEARSKLRASELATLQKAIEIIESESVAGAGEKHLPALVQATTATSFGQLRSHDYSPDQKKAAAFLAQRAKEIGSRMLEEIAQRTQEDPFKKVKKMIKDLVYKLMEEATAETEHKGWCDAELVTNKHTRDKKAEEVALLTQEIEDLTAQIAALTQDIDDLAAGIAELDESMAKATTDRAASKATNEETIADAKEAQDAVKGAMVMLRDFYAKASEATALVQQAPYQGMQSAAGGVMDFLEVILTDFARLQSETETQESMQAEEYDKFMFESKKDKALKENDVKHKEEMKTSRESDLQTAKEELASAQAALADAVAYYNKLKPTCVDSGITYEERVKQREEEIQSLKEALAMLEGLELPSVGTPGMKFNTYEESEYESKSTKSVKFEVSGEFSSSSGTA